MVHSKENVTEGTMADSEKMSVDERYKYLRKMQKRYREANRQGKRQLLNEMEAVTELHRKSIIRLMRGAIERTKRKRERGSRYKGDVVYALRVIAESLDWICAERLQPNLVWTAEHLAAHGELETTPELLAQLGAISVASVRRLLRGQPRTRPRLPRKRPEQANRLKHTIPAGRIPWQEQKPGHFEVDLVHHCGPSASGEYVHTLQMVDVATGWSERVAVLGRSYLVVKDGFERGMARLPFPIAEIHPDNGSEFLNAHLVRFWEDKAQIEQLSRSRPWYKNDNRFVEQKNDTLVRAYLGYDRLDTVAQTNLLNQLYTLMGLYYNFFQPVMRLAEKTVLPVEGSRYSRIQRRFDKAATPLDRLFRLADTKTLPPQQRLHLQTLRAALNPCQLRSDIYSLLNNLFALPSASPGGPSQNVYLTLFDVPDSMKGEATPVTLSIGRTIPAR
jgi:hypothetical protein